MSTSNRVGHRLAIALLLAGIVPPVAIAQQRQYPVDVASIRKSMPHPASAIVVKAPDGGVREIRPEATSIALKPGEYAVAKTAERVTEVKAPAGSGTGYQLPVTLTTVGTTGTPIVLGVIVRTGNGLMPRTDASKFDGRIYVGLINTLDPVTTIKLPAPVQVILAGPVESITPDQYNFDETNTFKPVDVIARNPTDPVQLRVSTGVAISETVVPLAVFNASVTVIAGAPSLAGFGFETVDLTVQAKGLPKLEGMPVTLFLQGGGGSFTPENLALDATGRANAKLRSSGVSPNVVVAATLGSGATAQATPIQYVWPVAWLAFAVGGGIIGGVVKQLTGERRAWLATIVVSVLLGFLAAGLYTVGVSTVPSIPAGVGGQLVVALIAALTSIGGVSLLPIPRS
jgi:hypothetical protein